MPADKPRLLYVVHQYFHLGGTELQTRMLAEGLAGRYEIAVVFPARLDDAPKLVVIRPDGQTAVYPADPIVFPLTPYRQPTTESSFAAVLRYFQPQIIHFQHFMHWPVSVIDQALGSGARIVVSLYDYYAITPDAPMLSAMTGGLADPLTTLSLEYSQHTFGADFTDYLRDRRQAMLRSLQSVHCRIVLSDFQRRVLQTVFPMEFSCIEPGIVPFEPLPSATSVGALRFGYMGSLIEQKGWESLVAAFQKVRGQYPNAELRLYGSPAVESQLPAHVSYCGSYVTTDLPRVLSAFDIGVIPSLFAETFCIVLSEMWHAGRPVAAADIGALSDRITDGVNGKKFTPGDVESIVQSLTWFIENRDWQNWRLPRVRTTADLVAEHDALYQSLLPSRL